jgi:hypothetical protein
MNTALVPPPVLDSARVVAYAVIDETVTHTGHTCFIVGGRVLQPAGGLAICQQLGDNDYLLFHCTRDWYVLGAGFHPSIQDAKAYAERGYRGVGKKWVELNTTEAAAREFMDRDIRGTACSFCGRVSEDGDDLTIGPTAAICDHCFEKTYALFESEGLT